MNLFPIRDVLCRELLEMLILLGTSGGAGHRVEVRLLSLMHVARVCYRSDPLLTLSQSLIELSQPLKSCGISLAQLLHMDGIGRPVFQRGKLGDGSLNQLIIVVAKGSLMTFNSLEVRNPLALGSEMSPLDLLRRWLGLLLWRGCCCCGCSVGCLLLRCASACRSCSASPTNSCNSSCCACWCRARQLVSSLAASSRSEDFFVFPEMFENFDLGRRRRQRVHSLPRARSRRPPSRSTWSSLKPAVAQLARPFCKRGTNARHRSPHLPKSVRRPRPCV